MIQRVDFSSVDIDQLMVKWEEALALRRARSRLAPIKRFLKKYVADPIIFMIVSTAIIIVPQKMLSFVSKKRLVKAAQTATIRVMDIFVAIFGLILSAPIWLVFPLLIKFDSPGPVFYKQMRTGVDRRKGERRRVSLGNGIERRNVDRRQVNLHGKPFHIIKFRTMKVDAEKKSGAVWATQNDPRITAIGRWMRKYHVDEIPQLLNVLTGHMSLVGPRPERPIIIADLLSQLPDYQSRLVVKPGVTGPAQIFLGYDRCMSDIERKIIFDSIYINNKSLRFFILLLALTAVKILASMIVMQPGIFNLNITLDKEGKSEEKVTYST